MTAPLDNAVPETVSAAQPPTVPALPADRVLTSIPVPPASPKPHQEAGEAPREVVATQEARADRAAFAMGCWVVYFGGLAGVYLAAFRGHEAAAEHVASWGLTASFLAAVAVLPMITRSLGSRAGHRRPGRRTLLAMAGGLLAAASVAVIWVAVNLTLAGSTAGAWEVSAIATAAPLSVLLGLLDRPRGLPGEAVPAVAAPRQAAPELPPPSPSALAVLDAPAVLDVPAVPDTPAALDTPAAPAARPVARTGFLTPGWEALLDSEPPQVAIDASFWALVKRALGRRRAEIGGVALAVRAQGVLALIGAVFPEQTTATHVYCEFPVDEVYQVREVIDTVADKLAIRRHDLAVTWLHTHPGLSVFLSGTDRSTTDEWRALDPEFTPIVLDPLAARLRDQVGVFGPGNQRVEPVEVVYGLVNARLTGVLRDALRTAYADSGRDDVLVLIPGRDDG